MKRLNKKKIITNIKNNNFKIKNIMYYSNLYNNKLFYVYYLMQKKAKHIGNLLGINKLFNTLNKFKSARL